MNIRIFFVLKIIDVFSDVNLKDFEEELTFLCYIYPIDLFLFVLIIYTFIMLQNINLDLLKWILFHIK